MLEQLARVSAIFQQLENQPPNLSLLQAASKLYDSLHQILFNTTKARAVKLESLLCEIKEDHVASQCLNDVSLEEFTVTPLWKKLYFPFISNVTGNGNCLYNSCSVLIVGKEDLHHLLRAIVSLELLINAKYYANHPCLLEKSTKYQDWTKNFIFNVSFSFEAVEKLPSGQTWTERYIKAVVNEASLNSKDKKFSSFMCFLALSSVVSCKIKSIFPKTGDLYEKIFNSTINPRLEATEILGKNLTILWTRSTEKVESKINHFVPLFIKHKFEHKTLDVIVEPPRKMMKLDGKGFVLEKERSNAPKSKGMKSRSITDFLTPLPTTLTTVPVPEKLPAPDEETPIEVNQQTGIDLAEATPENLNNAEKIRLIENVWKPPCDYNFP